MTVTKILLPIVLVLAIILPLQVTGCIGSQSKSGSQPESGSQSESLPVINFFTASPSSICRGYDEAAWLFWNVSGATKAYINPDIGDVALTDQVLVAPDDTTIYQLTASNSAGTVTATTQVTIDISRPIISGFMADPGVINRGGSATLSWDVWNKCGGTTIDNGIGYVPYYGDKVVHPNKTTIYTLTASNPSGSVTATVQVTVSGVEPATSPPEISFAAKTYTNDKYDASFQYPEDWVEMPEYLNNPVRVAAFGVLDFVPVVLFEVLDNPEPETADGIQAWLKARGNTNPKVLSAINHEILADGTPAYTYKVGYVSVTGYDVISYVLDADKGNKRYRIAVCTVDDFVPYDEALFSEIAHTLQFITYQNPDDGIT